MKSIKLIALSAILAATLSTSVFAHGDHRLIYTPKENIVAPKLEQVPGYYRVMLGDFEVTALYDGYLSIGTGVYQPFSKLSKAELDELISNEFRPMTKDGGVNTAVVGFLVNTGKNLILIDAGSGDVFDDKVGKLAASMKATGYEPKQDIILPTHLHFDHFSGVNAQRQNGISE